VQYLSLVWIYNRNRVEKDRSIGGFMHFVFRRSGSLVGLYIGLVFAYGSLGYFKETEIETIKRFLTGVVAASGLLHFYYDGFIWKVRERSTREHLGLSGGSSVAQVEPFLPSWLLHGLKWVVVFVIPLSALWIGQTRSTTPEIERAASIVQDVPKSARARVRYGDALEGADHFDEAGEQYRIALQISPSAEKAHSGLGRVFLAQSKLTEAEREMEQAIRDDSRNGEVHSDYGYVLEVSGRKDEARNEYEKGIQLNPKSGRVHYNYGMFLATTGQLDQAIAEFEMALQRKPKHPEAHYHLGHTLFLKGDLEGAKKHYLEAVRLDPKAPVHNSLGVIYMKLGQTAEAIAEFNEALRSQPNDAAAAENLRYALSKDTPSGATPR
jgi:tetratricopeptide (TPR) repeat protein